ncbi:hypothetical protein EXN66_Car009794 [Channa argus]|uniref:Uncharacterized protein n=1 Tax=Channa argus TaxID=215402 RepID=A0A6G1PVW5_CHAAH|nr:hypothetical protein EXN66_Car009794 [Channa argus]
MAHTGFRADPLSSTCSIRTCNSDSVSVTSSKSLFMRSRFPQDREKPQAFHHTLVACILLGSDCNTFETSTN